MIISDWSAFLTPVSELISDYALKGEAFVISSDIWENHGKLAEKLDEPEGQLVEGIINWLKASLENRDDISNLTRADYLQMLDEQYLNE